MICPVLQFLIRFREKLGPCPYGEKQVVRDVLYGAYCGGTKPGMMC